jgi:hypothetical protein
MKKTFLPLIYLTSTLIHCASLFAQETPLIPKPIKDFIATPQQDILKNNLTQANEQIFQTHKVDSQSTQEMTGSNSQNQKENDAFINPFVPQIPQATITTPFVSTQQSVTPNVVQETAPIPQFNVSGVIWHSKKLQAIVNGEIVTIGDRVSNWVVSEITKDGVHMTLEQQSLWVKPIINPEGETQAQPTNPYRR